MGSNKKSKNESTMLSEDARILEAVLFASDENLTVSRLKDILPDNPDARYIRKLVNEINIVLQKQRHPFEIVELGGGYQFRTVSYYQPWVQKIFKDKSSKRLSIQALECLAIIAYKQPITKSTVEAIRGVMSDGAMKKLLERHLIDIVGRSDKPGRPLLYGTTQEFLKYFGINKLADLPDIEEFEALAKEKMEEFSDDELQAAGVQTEMEMAEGETEEGSENQPENGEETTVNETSYDENDSEISADTVEIDTVELKEETNENIETEEPSDNIEEIPAEDENSESVAEQESEEDNGNSEETDDQDKEQQE